MSIVLARIIMKNDKNSLPSSEDIPQQPVAACLPPRRQRLLFVFFVIYFCAMGYNLCSVYSQTGTWSWFYTGLMLIALYFIVKYLYQGRIYQCKAKK